MKNCNKLEVIIDSFNQHEVILNGQDVFSVIEISVEPIPNKNSPHYKFFKVFPDYDKMKITLSFEVPQDNFKIICKD